MTQAGHGGGGGGDLARAGQVGGLELEERDSAVEALSLLAVSRGRG